MRTRFRIVGGSLAGAMAIHIMLVACSGESITASGDGGALVDVRNVIVDAVNDVLDAETPDAHAGGDGGACNCVEAPAYSFSGGAVTLDASSPQTPQADFSRAYGAPSLSRDETGSPLLTARVTTSYYLSDGGYVAVNCTVYARPDGSPAIQPAVLGSPAYDAYCQANYRGPTGSGVTGNTTEGSSVAVHLTGSRVTEITQSSITIVLPSIPISLRRAVDGGQASAGNGVIAPLTFRGSAPGSQWLTPSRSYRP